MSYSQMIGRETESPGLVTPDVINWHLTNNKCIQYRYDSLDQTVQEQLDRDEKKTLI